MLIDEVFGDITIVGHGSGGLRWPTPVRPGATVAGTVRTDAKRASGRDGTGLVETAVTATNQADEPVLTMVDSLRRALGAEATNHAHAVTLPRRLTPATSYLTGGPGRVVWTSQAGPSS
jgi:hypothetical protein